MDRNKLITPEGTKDYLFEEAAVRQSVQNKMRELFTSLGYDEVITPAIEFLDVFTVSDHCIPIEHMYKLVDNKGRCIVLRPDSTMPIARLTATRLKNEPKPLRLSYHQSVYSVNRSLRGRSDEAAQSGIELIGGCSNRKADMEVLTLAMKVMETFADKDFRMEIGHIGIFHSLMDALHLSSETKETIRTLIQNKNYPALQDLLEQLGDSPEIAALKLLPRLFGGEKVFDRAKKVITDAGTLQALETLQETYTLLSKMPFGDRVMVDLGIVHHADYYTGIVFRGYLEGHGEDLLSGGRYDGLLKEFGEAMSAIGFAVNIDSAVKVLLSSRDLKQIPKRVLVYSELGDQAKAYAHIEALIKQGIHAEYSFADTLEEAKEEACRAGIPQLDVVSAGQVETTQV